MGLENKLVVKKLELLLQDPHLVESYLRIHGPNLDVRKVEALKEQHARRFELETADDPDDPTFILPLKCPVCARENLTAYELKAKALAVTPDRFTIPRYSPIKHFRPLDYALWAVTVCPECLFASPDRKDFITFPVHLEGECPSQLPGFVLETLRARREERRALLAGIEDAAAYFEHPRKVAAAVAAYRLAVARARVEIGAKLPLACCKAGLYCLRIAMFLRDGGGSDRDLAREAVRYFETGYARSEIPSANLECQTLYLIVALHLRLESTVEAQPYLQLMERLAQLPLQEDSDERGVRPTAVDRWLRQAKDLWAVREEPKTWEH